MESLAQLELLCERLYNSQDSAERTHAENTLKCFSTNIDYISQCQYILDNALNPYALMLASSSLLKQVTEHNLSLQLRLDIRNYLVNYLANRGPQLQPFVIGSLVQLLCRLTKSGWFDDDRFRAVGKESINFLNQATSDHYAIGLKILNQLVCEIDQTNPGLPSSRHHRRVACSFRDQCLFQIFQISLTSLHQLKNDANERLQELALSLSSTCLSFDFVGTSTDESSDQFGNVQIPSSWKAVIEDSSTLQTYFDYYALTKPPISKKSLECLVKLAYVRWFFLTNDVSHSKFLNHLMSGTKEILRTGQGLADHDNYHEFCRLLGQFGVIQVSRSTPSKSEENDEHKKIAARKRTQQPQSPEPIIFTEQARVRRSRLSKSKENDDQQKNAARRRTQKPQSTTSIFFSEGARLSDLVTMEGYGDWIRLLADFTSKSLLSWQWASSSMYYLLGLWSSLVSSVPYLKGDSPSFLGEFVPNITEVFITSRLDSAQMGLPDNISEDPLDNVDLLQDQLDRFVPHLCRFQYEKNSSFIIKIMEPILQIYMEGAQLQSSDNIKLAVVEAKLAWIVHIIATVLKIKKSVGCSNESQDVIDVELAARVLRLVNVGDSGLHSQRYSELSKQRLDQAILAFFRNFRMPYVGDQAMLSSKVYAGLSGLIGQNDHLLLLDIFIRKISTNLKCYTENEEVISQTLSLFLDLVSGLSGHMTGKVILKLDTVKFIVAHHAREYFPFLEEYRCSRHRTTLYNTIGQLIFLEDSAALFKSSMDPLIQVFITLESTPETMFRTDSVKYALIGLMRDLRGIAMASNSRKTYGLLFDWIYPAHMPILLKGISQWADKPEVTTPLLKFMAEFVLKKTQHMTSHNSSPNGVLLFREVSKLVVAYGTIILSVPCTGDIYGFKYKGIWISLTILSRALAANDINFGLFELYGDRALVDALDIALKMTLSIPLADIFAYIKLTRAYFAFVEVLFNSHLVFVLSLGTRTFMHIVGSLELGLKGLNAGISCKCASAIDSLAAFYFSNITMGDTPTSPAAVHIARHIVEYPALLPEMLKTLFEIVLFEDCSNRWSISRPILTLILIDEQMFTDLKARILASQPVDQHQRLASCFDRLMVDITRSLYSKNRDKFAENLIVFKRDFYV